MKTVMLLIKKEITFICISLLVTSTVLIMVLTCNLYAQENLVDVVYLKNGSIVNGIIIEQIPNVSIKIQLRGGSVFIYKMEEIEKITKEPIKSPDKKISIETSFWGGNYYWYDGVKNKIGNGNSLKRIVIDNQKSLEEIIKFQDLKGTAKTIGYISLIPCVLGTIYYLSYLSTGSVQECRISIVLNSLSLIGSFTKWHFESKAWSHFDNAVLIYNRGLNNSFYMNFESNYMNKQFEIKIIFPLNFKN